MIRINRLGALAVVIAAGFAAPASAQVIYRDRWADREEARMRAEYQRDMQQQRMREQQQRMREQQDRLRERQVDRARELRERDMERAAELRERALERARELRERALERAQEARDRALERSQDLRDREVDLGYGRRIYITPPPSVRFRTRWPN